MWQNQQPTKQKLTLGMMFDASKEWVRHYGHHHSWCIHQSFEHIVHPKDFFHQIEQKQEHYPQTRRTMMMIRI